MANALACAKCGNTIASDRIKLEFDGNCPWCLASFALGGPPQAEPASTSLVPGARASDRLGKYLLTEKLGTGGMGEVWKALDTELNRWVALKFLKDQDPKELARFTREAHMTAKLTHPGIAAVHEIGEIGGRHFIAMQCIQGRTLETFPRNDRRLLVRLCLDAAKALDHAHRHGVIHRDVKPGNLMVEEADDGMKIVVLDFGLARSIEGGEKLSMSGSVVGTPQYLSPEQARAENLDERTDVYSLGATMYELFTGKAPFEGANVYEILKKIENEEPIPPRNINPQINQDLQTIILKCLEKNRERRYAGAKELAYDLKRFLNHEAVLARPPSTIYRLRMKLSKRKSLVAAVAAMLVLVAGSAIVLPRLGAEAEARNRLAGYQAAYDEGRNSWDEAQQLVRRAPLDRTLIKVRQARGHFEKAIAILEQADALVMRGRCLQMEGLVQEAEDAWERALVLDPGNQEARFHLAKRLLVHYLNERGTGLVMETGASKLTPRRIKLGPENQEASNLRRRAEKYLVAVGDGEKAAYLRGVREVCLGRLAEGAALLGQYNREGWDAASNTLEGLTRLYSGDLDGAIKACARAIELDPKQARAFYVRGIAKSVQGLHDEAIAEFTKAIELEPKVAALYANRGIAKTDKGLPDAMADFDVAIELDPACAGAYANRGKLKSDKGLHDEAIADGNKAIELDPKSQGMYVNRAISKNAKGLHDEAIADLDKAIQLDPGYALAYANRGTSKIDKGQIDEGIADFDKAIELNPKYALAHFNRGAAKGTKGLKDEALADYNQAIELDPNYSMTWNNRGILKADEGLVEEAIEDFEEAIKLDLKNAKAYLNRGIVREKKGLHGEALTDFEKAIELDPTLASAYVRRGTAKRAKGLHDEALADFDKAIELDPNDASAYTHRGTLKCDVKRLHNEAIADFDKAIALDPKNAGAYSNRGVAKRAKGFHAEALADLDKAIELDPKGANAYSNRGVAKEDKGLHDEAIADFNKAIELDPKKATAYCNRGNSKKNQGLRDEAMADYTRAIELDSKFALAYVGRGYLKALKGLHDEAIADYTKALDSDPENVAAYVNRGVAKQAKGFHAEAIADFDKAIERNPSLALVYSNRGVAKADMGLRDEAIADFDEAIELDPKYADPYYNRAIEKEFKGLHDEAIADYDEAIQRNPKYTEAYNNRGIAKWTKGLVDQAILDWKKTLEVAPPGYHHRAVVEELISTRGDRLIAEEAHRLLGQKKFREGIEKYKRFIASHPKAALADSCAYGIACGYALLGEKRNALDWLEKSVEMGWKNLAHLEKDADLDSLRNEDRYKKLTEKLRVK